MCVGSVQFMKGGEGCLIDFITEVDSNFVNCKHDASSADRNFEGHCILEIS